MLLQFSRGSANPAWACLGGSQQQVQFGNVPQVSHLPWMSGLGGLCSHGNGREQESQLNHAMLLFV